jgi:hypothetical protein
MKFRVALVTVLLVGLAASFAVAAPAKTPKNQTATDTTATTTTAPYIPEWVCHPSLLVMTGTLASVSDDQLSLTMLVKHSNKHARAYEGQTITVQVDTNTRIWRLGKKVGLGDLTLGDRLVVQTRACKKGTDVTAPLLAARVLDRPAKTAPTTTTTS